MKQTNKKTPLVFYIGVVMLCITLFTVHLSGGLYARYFSADDGGDGARVAGFSVDAAWSDDITIDYTQQQNGVYTLTLNNSSEVAVRCDLVLTIDADVLNAIRVTFGDLVGTVSGNTVTFTNIAELAPNATESLTKTLTFTVDDIDFFTKDASDESHNEQFAFDAKITCTQID